MSDTEASPRKGSAVRVAAVRARLRLGLPWLLLGLILVVAAVVRFYRLSDLTTFLGDQGRDVSIVWQMVLQRRPVLLGTTSSIGTYHRGAAYYYLLLLPLVLTHGNPAGAAALVALADLGALVLLYLIGRDLWNEWAGLTAAMLWAAAPLVVIYARFAWNPNLLPFFTLLTLYSLTRIVRGDERWGLLLLPAWVVAWQLHDEAILLLPVLAASVLWMRPRMRLSTVATSVGLSALTLLPFGAYEVTHRFANTRAMLAYVLTASRSGTSGSPAGTGISRIGRAMAVLDRLLPGPAVAHRGLEILCLIGVLGTLVLTGESASRHAGFFRVWLALPLLYCLWPGGFDPHYLAIVFPLPFLLCGVGLGMLRRLRPALGVAGFLAVSILTMVNAVAALTALGRQAPGPGTLGATSAVVDRVVAQSAGRPWTFRLVSAYEGFEAFDAPYRYLFALGGHAPGDEPWVDTYVVYDPATVQKGPARQGAVIDGIQVVHQGPPQFGPNILNPTGSTAASLFGSGWSLPGGDSARFEQSAGGVALALVATPTTGMVNATREFALTPGEQYLVRFQYRNALTAGTARVYCQVRSPSGATVATFPTGAGFVAQPTGAWTDAGFMVQVPEGATRAVLWLRDAGDGEVWFRDVQVREVLTHPRS